MTAQNSASGKGDFFAAVAGELGLATSLLRRDEDGDDTALGAAVAEKTGLFSAVIRKSLARAPRALLTPIVALVGMAMHHADAAAYLIYVPLAALTYAAPQGSLAALRHACAPRTAALRPMLRGLVHYHLGTAPLRTRRVGLALQRLA